MSSMAFSQDRETSVFLHGHKAFLKDILFVVEKLAMVLML